MNGVAIHGISISVMKRSSEDVALLEGGRASVVEKLLNGVALLEEECAKAVRRFLGDVEVLGRSVCVMWKPSDDVALLERE